MSYITREFYNSLYSEIDVADFERLAKQAEIRLNVYTHNRAKAFMDSFDEAEATDFEKMVHDAVQSTMCDLISKMSLAETSAASEGVTSVTNKGWSESYKVYTEEERKEELRSVMRAGLSGTGLAGAL